MTYAAVLFLISPNQKQCKYLWVGEQSNEKEPTPDGNGSQGGSQKHYTEIRKPDTEEYILSYSVYVKNSPNLSME